jgi:hypothetical protein
MFNIFKAIAPSILTFAAVLCLTSCSKEDISPRVTAVTDFNIDYGTQYDYQIENATSVIGQGTCAFLGPNLIEVNPDLPNAAPLYQQYVLVGESIRVYYDNDHWETLDYDAANSVLSGQVTDDDYLVIFLN